MKSNIFTIQELRLSLRRNLLCTCLGQSHQLWIKKKKMKEMMEKEEKEANKKSHLQIMQHLKR